MEIISMKNPLVSVIIPVYNVKDYVTECITHVINQTYTNLEIIIIDDGSTDESGTICDSLSKTDSRIKVYHTTNHGLSMARNYGLDHISGKYVTFIDSDDYIDLDYISTLLKLLLDNNADIAGCRFYRNADNGEFIYPEADKSYDIVLSPEEYLCRFYNDFGVFAPAWGKLTNAKIWKDLRFSSNRRIVEDAPMIRPMVVQCSKIAWTQKPMYFYRNRQNSLIHQKISADILINDVLKDIKYYTQHDMHLALACAYKHLCYQLILSWNDLSLQEKKKYKPLYRKSIRYILWHKGNTVLQKFKYSYKYFSLKI